MASEEDNHYFTSIQESAVLSYKTSTDYVVRNRIYNKYLHKPFLRMVEGILLRYKCHMGRYSHEELVGICLTHLIEKFERFDEWKPNALSITLPSCIEPTEGPFHIDTDHYGTIVSAVCDWDERIDSAIKGIVGTETIYINESLDCWIKLKQSGAKTTSILYYKNIDRNRKYLKDYYIRMFPDISEHDLEGRLEYLKYGIYSPLTEMRKAFSYCQTIVRNFFKNHSKETYDAKIKELEFVPFETESDGDDEEFPTKRNKNIMSSVIDEDEDNDVYISIFASLKERIQYELNYNEFLSETERKVGMVLIDSLQNHKAIFGDTNIKKTFLSMAKSGIEPKDYTKAMKRYVGIYNELKT